MYSPLVGTSWVVPSIPGYSRTHGLLLSIPGYSTYQGYTSLVPRPSPSFPSLEVGEGLVHFLTWEMSQTGQIIRTWVPCKPQKPSPTHTHWGARLFWVEWWQRTKAIHSSQDSLEDREFYQVVWVLLCTCWTLCNLYSRPWAEHHTLVVTHCCHAKPIHGACKRHTVQVNSPQPF